MKQKRNTRKRLITAIVILSTLLAILLGIVIYLNMTQDDHQPSEESTGPAGSEQTGTHEISTAPVDDMVISTDFCSLYFPGQWQDMVSTESFQSDDGGAVVFSGKAGTKEAELFTVLFTRSAHSTGIPVGVLNVDGETILVCVQMSETAGDESWSAEELDTIAAMREEVNYLIEQLIAQPDFSTDTSLMSPEQQKEDMEISTPFAILRYPGQWQDQVWTEFAQSDDGGYVTFFCAEDGDTVELFAVYFGIDGQNSSPVGAILVNGNYVKVSVQLYELENTHGSAAAMQEGMNHVLTSLSEQPGFTTDWTKATQNNETDAQTDPTASAGGEETDETTAPESEDLKVETSWCDLYFPVQWKDRVRTEREQSGEGEIVTFYGIVEETEVKLFQILFNTELRESITIGTITANGKTVNVAVVLPEFIPDDSWSDEAVDEVSIMQENINYVMEKLDENPAFTPAE